MVVVVGWFDDCVCLHGHIENIHNNAQKKFIEINTQTYSKQRLLLHRYSIVRYTKHDTKQIYMKYELRNRNRMPCADAVIVAIVYLVDVFAQFAHPLFLDGAISIYLFFSFSLFLSFTLVHLFEYSLNNSYHLIECHVHIVFFLVD